MRRIIALTLAFVMLLAFSACGKAEDAIKGTWKTEIQMGKVLNAMGTSSAEDYVADIVKGITVGITLTLKEDNTFTLQIDANKLQEDFKAAMKEKLPAILAEKLGMTEEALMEALASQNKTVDDLVDQAMSGDNMFKVNNANGTYKYEEGKLFLKGNNSEKEDFRNYVDCKVEGDKLTITGVHSEENIGDINLDALASIFPIVFAK